MSSDAGPGESTGRGSVRSRRTPAGGTGRAAARRGRVDDTGSASAGRPSGGNTDGGRPSAGKTATAAPGRSARDRAAAATRRAIGRRAIGRRAIGRGTGEVDIAERGPGGRWPVPERSVLATVLGISPWPAVAVAAAATALGVVVDLLRLGTLGTVFTVCYLSGCILAVAWVRRRSLFGPMVQPPLLLAGTVPVVVLLAGSPRPGSGISERLLTIGAPLVNSFPTMAWTTAAVLALGTGRLLAQRERGDEPVSAPPGPDATRGAGRRSASPRRS